MNKKKIAAVIPARMASSRFPGKPLVDILGLPMIEHVRRRALLSEIFNDVYVATCDNEIKETVERYGGKAVMTADTHQRCTDRIEEAAEKLDVDIVVIISGDEPLIDPGPFDLVVRPIVRDKKAECVNLVSVISEEGDLNNTDVVKAVLNNRGYIMYYSRLPVPYMRVKNNCPAYRQTGISAFTKTFLRQYSSLPHTTMEIAESIDFLRILEHGYPIYSVIYPQRTVAVDRESDVEEVEKILLQDPAQQAFYQKIR
ncbi:MAG: 3-deoxy-manno-octulosonate cytidylyltransferase [Candidatus Omnitrophica bacterium]|nr:3-deoxy-manno-octulosonate cytidylyltransferase [Candidatus Omnitrophota bacterium]MBU2044069.1 3-deoxy-manno-octulosonate cytidylyltransferase [Candidatus Omnitrophota bacterium]MBU2251076.1 3-deoxy-manno-octulosonate cytidylyltransferase [Candidatus Omnitrophota bacterium]